ncbi:hypothetical protein I4U23_020344 [Adineta vaga]|nr:hypothetical protein I4U23_020344 [Adineta vaga]
MTHLLWIVLTISIVSISTNHVVSDKYFDNLPQSLFELKQYYDVMNNLQKRSIINSDIADQEKRLYIEYASKLVGRQELLTEEEFLTWKQRELIISFSNIIAILAGVIVTIAIVIFIGIFLVPLLVRIPLVIWEVLAYIISIGLMIYVSHSWLIFLGCLLFVAILSFSVKTRVSNDKHLGIILSWTCFIVWTIVAIYQQHREAGYLAVMALESALGFVIFVGQLVMIIGFQNEKAIPSGTIASFILILLGSILHLQQKINILTVPFARPSLFLGTFVYFIGMLILSSSLYLRRGRKKHIYWFLQFVMFLSGLAAMFLGPLLQLPFIQAIGGTMFVIWLLEKYVEIAPWNGTFKVIGSLFGFGSLLYGFAYFLQNNPEYFIFHTYSLD